MRNFKRVGLSLLCFACMAAVVSAAVLGLYYNTELQYFMDSRLRRELAGSVDLLVMGSSHAWNGIVPQVLDETLGANSYNLSGGIVPMYAKILMVEKELRRNPVETVLIEVAYDTMTRDNATDYAEGDEIIIARLDNWGERLDYMRRFLSLSDMGNVYSRALLRGVQAWLALFTGGGGVDDAAKGYYAKDGNDVTIPPDKVDALYCSKDFADVMADYRQVNLEQLEQLIQVCRQYGAEPILINTPLSDHENWKMQNWALFSDWFQGFAEAQGCRAYDFNLLRNRYALFSDDRSFRDECHLCRVGAQVFTEELARILLRAKSGEDVSGAFYGSYEEMLKDSPYATR